MRKESVILRRSRRISVLRFFASLRMTWVLIGVLIVSLLHFQKAYATSTEVLPETQTRVIIRKHAKTGKPYVSIVALDAPLPPDSYEEPPILERPDYRLLDPKQKGIPYTGPSSDRRKVYVLAGTLAALGVAGGAALAATAAGGASAGAAGGAGTFAGGAALTGLGTAGGVVTAHSDPNPDDFSQSAESNLEERPEGASRIS